LNRYEKNADKVFPTAKMKKQTNMKVIIQRFTDQQLKKGKKIQTTQSQLANLLFFFAALQQQQAGQAGSDCLQSNSFFISTKK